MQYDNKKESAIEILGAFGVGLSLFCLIQLFIFLQTANLFVIFLILGYITSSIAFILYFKMRSIYIYFLGVGTAITLICTAYFIVKGILSPLQVILALLNMTVFLISFELKHLQYIKKVEIYKKS